MAPGRQKNNGMGYFYGGAKQWATSRWDAGGWLWCGAAGASRGLVGGKGGQTLNLPHCQLSALPISSLRQPDAPLSPSAAPAPAAALVAGREQKERERERGGTSKQGGYYGKVMHVDTRL